MWCHLIWFVTPNHSSLVCNAIEDANGNQPLLFLCVSIVMLNKIFFNAIPKPAFAPSYPSIHPSIHKPISPSEFFLRYFLNLFTVFLSFEMHNVCTMFITSHFDSLFLLIIFSCFSFEWLHNHNILFNTIKTPTRV